MPCPKCSANWPKMLRSILAPVFDASTDNSTFCPTAEVDATSTAKVKMIRTKCLRSGLKHPNEERSLSFSDLWKTMGLCLRMVVIVMHCFTGARLLTTELLRFMPSKSIQSDRKFHFDGLYEDNVTSMRIRFIRLIPSCIVAGARVSQRYT